MDGSRENALIMLLISDPDMRVVIRDTLASQGYLVQATGDIGVAVDMLRESPLWVIKRSLANGISRLAPGVFRPKGPFD